MASGVDIARSSRLISAVDPNGLREVMPEIVLVWESSSVMLWLDGSVMARVVDAIGLFWFPPRLLQCFHQILSGMIWWPPLSQLSPRLVVVSPLFSDWGETLKGGDQQEGELGMGNGLDSAMCLMDGLDGAGVDDIGVVGDGSYSEEVQCAKEIYPILRISCGVNDKDFGPFDS
jgi:hypothetical protein